MMAITLEKPPAQPVEALPIERRRFTADEFERMAEVGIITDQERVELIDGEIVVMSRIGSPHAAYRARLNQLFAGMLDDRALIGIQAPVRLESDSLVIPDVVLLSPRDDDYASGHPGPADLFLLIEVMDTSIFYDRNIKLPLYARSGVPEVWLTDIHGGFIEAHRVPSEGAYTEKRIYQIGERIASEAFPDLILGVGEIVRR